VKVIDNETVVSEVSYTDTVTVMCSIGNAPFEAKVTIWYRPVSLLLELISVRTYLREVASLQPTTIEGLCSDIFTKVVDALGLGAPVQVTVEAATEVHGPTVATCVS